MTVAGAIIEALGVSLSVVALVGCGYTVGAARERIRHTRRADRTPSPRP